MTALSDLDLPHLGIDIFIEGQTDRTVGLDAVVVVHNNQVVEPQSAGKRDSCALALVVYDTKW